MENFKEIAEKCLTGELSGTFINRRGDVIPSDMLHKYDSIKYPYIYWETNFITRNGAYFYNEEKISDYDITDFIPDNMQKQVKIDIPEGKVPVMEQTENGVVITWKEKELTYEDIVKTSKGNFPYSYIRDLLSLTGQQAVRSSSKTTEDNFYKKVEALRKLINIRNYFGKPSNESGTCGWVIRNDGAVRGIVAGYPHLPVFAKKEHAEQAIKMLGDELKYLFEPW